MEVILKFHDSTRPQLNALWRSLADDRGIRNVMFDSYLEMIRDRLAEYSGVPPEAEMDPEVVNYYIWNFNKRTRLHYSIYQEPTPGMWKIGSWIAEFWAETV